MGKQDTEGRRGGTLWEGSQSNYRQRCSRGFFGGTKFTFQQSPSPSSKYLFASPIFASPSCSCWCLTPPLTVHLPTSCFLLFRFCLSWLPKSGRGMQLFHQQSIKSCHPIAVSCSHLKDACSSLTCLCLSLLYRRLSALCRGAVTRAHRVALTICRLRYQVWCTCTHLHNDNEQRSPLRTSAVMQLSWLFITCFLSPHF